MRKITTAEPEVPPLSPLPPPTASLSMLWKVIGIVVFLLYLAFAGIHAANTPLLQIGTGSLINAPDESAHLEFIRILSSEGRLPTNHDRTYEWHQPPLYYQLAASIFRLGTPALRWLGILFGAITLTLMFLAVRKLMPDEPKLAVFAMALVALLPMRHAVMASIGNDSLTELCFSSVLYASIALFTNGVTKQRAMLIGVLLGCAFITKASGLLLVPIVVIMAFYLWKDAGESLRKSLVACGIILSIGLMALAPWLARNKQLLGTWTPMSAFAMEFAGTSKASDWIDSPQVDDLWSGRISSAVQPMTRIGYLRLLANWTMRTGFGAYTTPRGAERGIPTFMPPTFYLPFLILGLVATFGMVRCHVNRKQWFTPIQTAWIRIFIVTSALVCLSFVVFVWTYFQAQGRYLYPAAMPIGILSGIAIRKALPEKYVDRFCFGVIGLLALLSMAFAMAI